MQKDSLRRETIQGHLVEDFIRVSLPNLDSIKTSSFLSLSFVDKFFIIKNLIEN
ncbi:hypothetical protein RHAB15C_0000590 [Candidatus Rhabdochlamydia porcellionis]|jgi:hypothetical protein|uniref:Uncharacterized protein n=1 Tax=Candidatus Rhabdochlamydia porcellionis TaxID=225148 RepID=A0ABX8Z2C8_9BACT|nr:hypothetical protein RHAB15C_0000590 [Candidatus Rhabdochlamydia porcellionis]